MGKRHEVIIYKMKPISYLKVKEGEMEISKGNKETHQKEKTGQKKHGRVQSFQIPLDECCGFATVEYWGDITLMDGGIIEVGAYYPKQIKGTIKDPKTFVTKKQSKLVLILHSLNRVVPPVNQMEQEKQEELVSVNEELQILDEPAEEKVELPELE